MDNLFLCSQNLGDIANCIPYTISKAQMHSDDLLIIIGALWKVIVFAFIVRMIGKSIVYS